MKTILVPTDFSSYSDNALRYAAALSMKMDARILVFHSYHVPVPATDVPIDIKSEAELKKSALKSLHDLKESFGKEFPDTRFSIETTSGFADDEIIERVTKEKCDYVVMGTHGSSGLVEVLLGSNTAKVIEKAACPVFAIPGEAVFEGLNRIVFAADYGTHNFNNALGIVEMARTFGSQVNLLHIRSGDMDETMEYAELESFKNRVCRESGYDKVSFTLIDHSDVFQGLNGYLEEERPDLLVLSMRNRNFVQKVFSRSLTKRMAHHAHIPLLVLHISH
jgi:nucleotide-binding universal stress UspA family protein